MDTLDHIKVNSVNKILTVNWEIMFALIFAE